MWDPTFDDRDIPGYSGETLWSPRNLRSPDCLFLTSLYMSVGVKLFLK